MTEGEDLWKEKVLQNVIHIGAYTMASRHKLHTHTHMNDIAADGSKYEFKCAKLYFKLYVCMYANM